MAGGPLRIASGGPPTKIGVVRYTDTGEVFRIVYPEHHENDSVLDDPCWTTVNIDPSRHCELLKIDAAEASRIWFGQLPRDLLA